ncbi:SRPBCC family protein [Flavobacterium silvaticum]|uniref:Polyketide cyclase n=1 Tax=Flavobacterium silvaticum TaxID=1852020 RepID=A0A972FU82_9FLAO|nr:SRPBCC family protein [Flavobacterium silvaticum]NMH28117.1 polyketide cyclase [Flavobacterium silvaticum]
MEKNTIFAGSQMLICKPAPEVFNAFIDPEQTVNFWFTKSSGKLEAGKTVLWEWEMYGAKAVVDVLEIIPDEQISIRWGDKKRRVDFRFTPKSDNATYVECIETGYTETYAELIAVIRDSTGGFTTVVDGLKAWLEHGIRLNLIGDKFPSGK